MKRIDYFVLGLLTLSCAVLTNEIVSCHYFSGTDKLLLTALWSGWLVAIVYYYFQLTKDYKFSYHAHGGWLLGLGIGVECNQNSRAFHMILPFVVLDFKWTRK
tara:strand:- start:323 stop:631 length:309 start_codon:yes stop_codon:yes gene_type:complete